MNQHDIYTDKPKIDDALVVPSREFEVEKLVGTFL